MSIEDLEAKMDQLQEEIDSPKIEALKKQNAELQKRLAAVVVTPTPEEKARAAYEAEKARVQALPAPYDDRTKAERAAARNALRRMGEKLPAPAPVDDSSSRIEACRLEIAALPQPPRNRTDAWRTQRAADVASIMRHWGFDR